MNESTRKILIFLLVAVGAFALAFGLGRVAGEKKEPAQEHEHEATAERYRVKLADDALPEGRQRLRFSVLDGDGEAVTAYDTVHEKELHLIVVERADPRVYRHLHPRLDDGAWSTTSDLPAGSYRLYADTTPSGAEAQVLTADFTVEGNRERPGVDFATTNDTATVDGYDVALAHDGAMYTFTVTRAGKPVDLEEYLGAGGHLVGIRSESLDYLHAHAGEAEGNSVGFHVAASNAGAWVLHLDFQVDGKVHDATFVQRLEVDGPGGGMGEHMDHDMDDMDGTETEGHEHQH